MVKDEEIERIRLKKLKEIRKIEFHITCQILFKNRRKKIDLLR